MRVHEYLAKIRTLFETKESGKYKKIIIILIIRYKKIVWLVISKRYRCYFNLCLFVLDIYKRNTLWLRDAVKQTSQRMQLTHWNDKSQGLTISQIIVYPCVHGDASRAKSAIRCPEAEDLSIYRIPQCVSLYIWSDFTEMCNRSPWNPTNH